MKAINKRLIWTSFLLVFFFLTVAARVWYIQVIRGEYYSRMALAGETSEVALEDYPRGQILDRNLQTLTGSYSANRIVVFPQAVESPEAMSGRLAAILGVDPGRVEELIAGNKPVILPFSISGHQLASIQRADLKGVIVAPYSFRYGSRPLAANVVGCLGRIKGLAEMEDLSRLNGKNYGLNDWTGRQGLEYFYEKELKGQYPSGFAGICNDARGDSLKGLPVLVNTRQGDSTRCDVVTTIDAGIQDVVERVMDKHIKKGAVVVMDTSTGDILAMASRPTYNPDPSKGGELPAEDERYINQALTCFQPGSVFKVVLAVAGLSEGVVNPDTIFECLGAKAKPIRCWKPEGHGRITFSEAFAQSCNPSFVKLGQELGARRIIDYARKLGLDNQTVLGYPAPPDSRQNLDLIAGKNCLANSSIGQGPVLATPLQITAMTNTVASGGLYLQPRLVKEVLPFRGSPREIKPAKPVRVMTPDVARVMAALMAGVTEDGVGRSAWITQGGSAGKTGSAELGENGLINAWFTGYAPLNKPQYTITVLVREGVSGGESAAPVFKEIAEQIMAR